MGVVTIDAVGASGKWYENPNFFRVIKVVGLFGAGFSLGLLMGRKGY